MSATTSSAPDDPTVLAETVQTFRVFCGLVLLSYAKHTTAPRDVTIGHFMARGMVCLENILRVWEAGSESDAWILHRALLDRLFHLHALADRNEFSAFEDFSFMARYEVRHKLLSHPEFKTRVPDHLRRLQQEEKERYEALHRKGGRWTRPKAEDVAKTMGMGFLYHFGYDLASTQVHPMARDGEADFERLTAPPGTHPLPDATVVRNSILAESMLVQEGLNASSLQWRRIVYDFLDQIRTFLIDGNPQFHATFYKIGKAQPEFELCENPPKPPGTPASD